MNSNEHVGNDFVVSNGQVDGNVCNTARSVGWTLIPEEAPLDGAGVEIKYKAIRYDLFVDKLFKKDNEDAMLMHAALGICGEAGEVAEAIKKAVVYGKIIDRNYIIEEIGDLRFYIQALCNVLKIDEQEILNANGAKLAKRYAGLQYSNAAAIARADKTGNEHG